MTAVIWSLEANAEYRRVPLHLVQTSDGVTPATAEAGGQPQRSQLGVGGASAWTNTSAVLVHIGNGLYYVTLSAVEVAIGGMGIIRYKSANTLEAQSDYQVVAYNPYSGPWTTIGGIGVAFTWQEWDNTPPNNANTVPNPNVAITINQSTVGPTVAPIVSGATNALGQVAFVLPAGIYQLWRFKAGYDFTNPVQITVS